MKIALLEAFYTGSHKTWADELKQYSSHEITLFTLPGSHWKWRMHGGAVSIAKQFLSDDSSFDLILATDMLDLTTFLSLTRKKSANIPVAIYFHENQLNYPRKPDDEDMAKNRDLHYSFINYTSALTADRVFFNSQYHHDAFINELPAFLKIFPDHQEIGNIKIIEAKSSVLPLGLDLKRLDQHQGEKHKTPTILWNHRWEYDKNPETFFETLYKLQEDDYNFELIVLGEHYPQYPKIFDEAKKILANKIIHWGYVDSFSNYAQLLWKANILPITSFHDFFGISVVQAMYCGVTPLTPNRLVYPEHINHDNQYSYQDKNELLKKLKQLIDSKEYSSTRHFIHQYDWGNSIAQYDKALSNCRDGVRV